MGIPSVSLWAAVPHYVQLTPSPRAAKALCDRLAGLLDLPIDTTELDEASEAYIQQTMANNPPIAHLLIQLFITHFDPDLGPATMERRMVNARRNDWAKGFTICGSIN